MSAYARKKPKLLVIVGPTASGKSELAVRLAKKFKGEIVSADSRQIYKGLDIGTAKVSGRWSACPPPSSLVGDEVGRKKVFVYKNIPHHCIDFVSPRKAYTAAEYQRCAASAITDITWRGKLPILVGGTGFWMDAVVYDIKIPAVPPDSALRKELKKKSARELVVLLAKLDPRRAKDIEQKNPRRLIRAIEIARVLGRVPNRARTHPYDTLWIGIHPEAEQLEKNIRKRARHMIAKGLVREIKKLRSQGISKKRIRELGFEYSLALNAAEGTLTRRDLLAKLIQKTKRYARRQMTWWKRNHAIHWNADEAALESLIKKSGFAGPGRKNQEAA